MKFVLEVEVRSLLRLVTGSDRREHLSGAGRKDCLGVMLAHKMAQSG